MKKLLILFFVFTHFCVYPSVVVGMPKVSAEKQQKMRQYIYDTDDFENVLHSAISTLQDSDFIIEEYEPDLGFIRATKTFKSHYVSKKRVAGWSAVLALATAYTVFSYGATAYSMYSPTRRVANEMRDKTVVVDANVFVEQIGTKQVRVRFLPVAKVLQNADGFSFMTAAPVRILRIYNPKVYTEFFNQVGNNLIF